MRSTPPAALVGRGGDDMFFTRILARRLSHRPRPLLSIVVLLVFLASQCLAQRDPVKNFCRRFGHQTAVIDRRLYIDGGLINWNPIPSYPSNYSNTWLLYQDLDEVSSGGMPQLYANLSKNSSIPDVNGGILWEDNVNKKFYLFGGEYYQEPPATSFILYAYDTIYDHWDSLGSPQQAAINSVSYGTGVSDSDRGIAYYYGGWLSNNSVASWSGPPVATNALIKYEMDSNSWTNNTGPNDNIRRAEGAMVYLPVGDGGMLVYFGGVQDLYQNGTITGQSLEQIFMYDVLSAKWYTQNSTGTIPDMRRRFCAGATWAPDQSSYNIYLYGGASMPPNTTGYDDVYVLSIPTFTWVKLYPTDGNYTGSYPHHSLSCNVISGAQMLIIGGTFPLTQDCDAPDQWGTHNLDMGEQNPEKVPWQLFSENKTTYAVPDPIVAVVGGSGGGGATKTAPANGFSNPDLKILMTRKASVATRTPTRAIPNATGNPSSGGSLSTGAIAGIAVGGAVALIAFVLAVCFFIRRHRKKRKQYQPPPGVAPGYSDSGMASPYSSHYTPASPYPTSPFAVRRQQAPVELAATGTNAWSPGGDVMTPQHTHHSVSPAPGTGTGSSSGYEAPKVDDQGRVWFPQTSNVHVAPPRLSPTTEFPGQSYSPRSAGSRPSMPPQELSSDSRGDWDPNTERRHNTYYHR